MAQISGVHDAKTSAAATVYDPTCGSGSLLLKIGDEASADVDALQRYWDVCPNLRKALFKRMRSGYLNLRVEKSAIYEHPELAEFITGMNAHFAAWRKKSARKLKALKTCCHPKEIVVQLSDMDTEIVALDAKLAKARQIKQGMMQELLTGRIRLI